MAELYLITPPKIDTGFVDQLASTLQSGTVSALQIRLKSHNREEINQLAPPLVKLAQDHAVTVIMNDDPELADRLGCDGVHIGQEDTSYKQARAIMGQDRIVGVTCHDSRHLAMLAGERGANYVAFGALFESATKPQKSSAPLELLTWWSDLFETPCVGIGGITLSNAPTVIKSGADYLAVCGGVWSHPDGPEATCAAFSQLLQ